MTQPQPDGYLALPPSGSGPGVLVLHAWWGLNDTMKAICDRLAENGLVVFAPDLYHGRVADTIDGAKELLQALNAGGAQAQTEVAEAAAYLNDLAVTNGRGLGVIGFSLGAYYALDLSNAAPQLIDSVVVFYGTGEDDFSNSQAAYLGHFAADDPFEPQESVEHLQESLRSAERSVTVFTYPGTGHWFFEPDRSDAYDENAAELAWERTLEFLLLGSAG